MSETIKMVLTVLISLAASSGFWSWVNSCKKKDSAEKRLLIGLAHDRIIYLGNKYLQRGNWITAEEFENLNTYLYEPYHEYGGNGTAEKVMTEVKTKLSTVQTAPVPEKNKKVDDRYGS